MSYGHKDALALGHESTPFEASIQSPRFRLAVFGFETAQPLVYTAFSILFVCVRCNLHD